MPRKKSVSGRARIKTKENTLQLQAEKVTKRMRSLEKAGEYGKLMAQKKLMHFAQINPFVSIRKSRGSKRRRLIISKVKKTIQQQRDIRIALQTFLKSKVSSPIGIKSAREKQRKSLTETLTGIKGESVSDAEVDKFIEITEYADESMQVNIIEKIGKSEFFALVHDAKEQGKNVPQWIDTLNDYVSINNDYMRNQAEELYYRFVA